jgi:ABC-type dipeptide/oligopeptide/nickel transport system permease subunit
MALRHLRRNPGAMVGIVILAVLIVVAVFAHQLMPNDPYVYKSALRRQGFSSEAWLGRDELGRDMLSRVILGTRIAFGVASVAVLIGLVVGSLIGMVAGYAGGKVDSALSMLIDMLLAFPTLLFAIVIVAALGPGIGNTALAIGISSIPGFARIARGSTLVVQNQEYVQSARAIGAQSYRIVALHILPNILTPLIVVSTVSLARAVLADASLSFLGLGAQPPEPSWGSMASSGRQFLRSNPHIVLVPSVAIMLAVLAFNLIGDGLRDALDPRLRTSGSD